MNSSVFTLMLLIIIQRAASSPDNGKPCNRNDPNFNQCLTDNMNAALQANPEGDKMLNQLMPVFPELVIDVGPLNLTLQNVFVKGLGNFTVSDFQINPENSTLSFIGSNPELVWHQNYTANLNDNDENDEDNEIEGDGDIHFENGKYLFTYQYEPYEMNGEQHINVTNGETNFLQSDIDAEMNELESNPKYRAAWNNLLQNIGNVENVKKACANFIKYYYLNDALRNIPLDAIIVE